MARPPGRAELVVILPSSATHAAVAWIGVIIMLGSVAVLNSWAPDYFDPHSNADTFAHNDDDSDTPKIKPLAWRTHWLVPELTKLTLAAAKEIDTEKRKKEYEDLQKTVTDDGPFVLMFQNANQVALRSNIKGFKLGLFEDFNYYRTISK